MNTAHQLHQVRLLTLLPGCEKFAMLKSMPGSPSLGVLGAVPGECLMFSSVSPLTPPSTGLEVPGPGGRPGPSWQYAVAMSSLL